MAREIALTVLVQLGQLTASRQSRSMVTSHFRIVSKVVTTLFYPVTLDRDTDKLR